MTPPVIISVVGRHLLYNHVVIVWKGQVIDYESRTIYLLSEDTVNGICGPHNPFVTVSRGYIILPSKKMKKAVNDFSDWGEISLRQNHAFLFRNHK
jgi:hypothetical protein